MATCMSPPAIWASCVTNGTNGAPLDTFVPPDTNGVPDAANLLFGPDENLYVYSASSNAVMRLTAAPAGSLTTS